MAGVARLEWTAAGVAEAVGGMAAAPDLVLAADLAYPYKDTGPLLEALAALLPAGAATEVLLSYGWRYKALLPAGPPGPRHLGGRSLPLLTLPMEVQPCTSAGPLDSPDSPETVVPRFSWLRSLYCPAPRALLIGLAPSDSVGSCQGRRARPGVCPAAVRDGGVRGVEPNRRQQRGGGQ